MKTYENYLNKDETFWSPKHASLKPQTSMQLKLQNVINLWPRKSISRKAPESRRLKAQK